MTSTEQPRANQAVTTPQLSSNLEEAFADTDFPMPPGHTPLWCPGAVSGEWTDLCGFIKHRARTTYGRFVYMELSQFSARPSASVQKITSCHHEVWLHLDFVGNQYAHESRGNHEQRVFLKEGSCPYPLNKEKGRDDDESDHSPPSLSSVRALVLHKQRVRRVKDIQL